MNQRHFGIFEQGTPRRQHGSPGTLRSLLTLAVFLLPGTAAQAGESTLPNPSVTWDTPGDYTVSLQVCNAAGCTTTSRTVTVLDPRPVITEASSDGAIANAVSVHAGDLVHLFGSGTGQPDLSYAWVIQPLAPGPPPVSLLGAEGWWDTTGVAPGPYSAVLSLWNASGTVTSTPIVVEVLPASRLGFYTVKPCRLFDSRASGGPLTTGAPVTILAAACGIPPTARALSVNMTVVSPTASGVLNVYPANYPVPGTSELSFRAGTTRANGGVIGASTAGVLAFKARAILEPGGTVDVILDVNGYFAPVP